NNCEGLKSKHIVPVPVLFLFRGTPVKLTRKVHEHKVVKLRFDYSCFLVLPPEEREKPFSLRRLNERNIQKNVTEGAPDRCTILIRQDDMVDVLIRVPYYFPFLGVAQVYGENCCSRLRS